MSGQNTPFLLVTTIGNYAVRVTGANGCGTTSDEFVVDTIVGVENLARRDFELDIFPDPSVEYCNVRFTLPAPSVVTMTVVDIFGREFPILREHADGGTSRKTISVRGFAPGVYFLRLSTERMAAAKRFLIGR